MTSRAAHDPPARPAETTELEALGALAEPNRRALYRYVVSRHDWVGRDEAAAALGLRRGVTVHHLERLEAEGLLESDHRRLNGRSGPGAGRPAKVYRRAPGDFSVSLPPRRYDLAAHLLADAATRARGGQDIDTAITAAAHAQGRRIGQRARTRAADQADQADLATRRRALFEELERDGFEPVAGPDGVTVLHNCPFHELSATHTELVCGLNHTMLTAAVDHAADPALQARLEPEPGHCCVRFHPRNQPETPQRATDGDPRR